MSQVNDTNYPNQVPVAADYLLFARDSDNVLKTVTMTQLGALLQSLADQINTVTVYSANQTLSDEQMVEVNAAGATNITLPASTLNRGRGYWVYNKGAGVATVLPNGADTIAGGASLALAQYGFKYIKSDGLGDWAVSN